jgi:putative ABC transport system ATP-binding protein
MKDKNIVLLHKVSKSYRLNEHSSVGVKDIDFVAKPSELVLFLGPSGSGKTTLLTLIAGLLKPSEGNISLFQKQIETYSNLELQNLRAKRIGFIFQTFLLIDAFTALQNIELVLKFTSRSKREAAKTAKNLLKELQIEYLANKLPVTMSQGEKQRIAVARAIANKAELILADEPTASLDAENGSIIIDLLHSYAKKNNKCVIVVSHDLRLKEYADRIIYLDDGRIVG